jgi:hypothetical protein
LRVATELCRFWFSISSGQFRSCLHRILHRFGGIRIVGIGELQIVPTANGLAVTHPTADFPLGMRLGQLTLPGRSQILKQLGPRFNAGPADDPLKACA